MIKKTDTEQAGEIIIKMLSSGEVESGRALKESVIARTHNLSRSSVREALNLAVGMGIVEYVPFCGYQVRNFTLRDLLEWYEIREAIEPIAARRLAALRPVAVIKELDSFLTKMERAIESSEAAKATDYDLKFHLAVINKCGNSAFTRINKLGYIPSLLFMKSSSRIFEQHYTVPNSTNELLHENYNYEEYETLGKKLTVEMHREMFDSIRDGDPEKAEELFRLHASRLVKNVTNILVTVDSGKVIDSVFV